MLYYLGSGQELLPELGVDVFVPLRIPGTSDMIISTFFGGPGGT